MPYQMNLGLCCKRCGDWLAAEEHYNASLTFCMQHAHAPELQSFIRTLRTNLLALQTAANDPLGVGAPPERATGMRTGPEQCERLRQRGNAFFKVGRCRLTVSKPMLKARGTKRLKL